MENKICDICNIAIHPVNLVEKDGKQYHSICLEQEPQENEKKLTFSELLHRYMEEFKEFEENFFKKYGR